MSEIIAAYIGTEWLPVVAAIISLANAATMVLKSKVNNPIAQFAMDALNTISLNVLANRNADR